MEQNREPRNKPLYTQSIHGKEAKNIPSRKEHLFNKWYYEKWKATCKRMKLNSSKWIIELNIRTTTVKSEETQGLSSLTSVLATVFCVFDTKSKDKREKKKKAKNKCDYIKLISLCMAKEAINNMKRQPTE